MKLPFTRLFDSTNAIILDLLLNHRDCQYSVNEIEQLTKVSKRTLERYLPKLLDEKIIYRKKRGHEFCYFVDRYNPRVKALLDYLKATDMD